MSGSSLLITGATGLIGRQLIPYLLANHFSVTVFTRNIQRATTLFGDTVNYWDSLPNKLDNEQFFGVINLAGEPIADKRWTPKQKKILETSRWQITEKLTQSILSSASPPRVFISGSAVGYYGDCGSRVLSESSSFHDEFVHALCQRWETLALASASAQTRVCVLRTGLVLAREGGFLAKLLPVFKMGIGGKLGNGKQFMSLIHIQDMVQAILFLLLNESIQGPVNMVIPNPIDNQTFTQMLAKELHRPAFMTVPSAVLELVFGELSTVLLGSQRAIPEALQEVGFKFNYPDLRSALKEIFKS